MFTDDRKQTREPGIRRILKALQLSQSSSTKQALMQFRLFRLNFSCKDYTETIDWSIEN